MKRVVVSSVNNQAYLEATTRMGLQKTDPEELQSEFDGDDDGDDGSQEWFSDEGEEAR